MSTSRASALLLCALAAPAAAQSLTKLSVSPSGAAGNAPSALVELKDCMSPDGRFVLFVSSASNLVAGDTNGFDDVFVRDTLLGTTTLVSLTSIGAQPNDDSLGGAISDDGRWVAFQSTAGNVVAGDFNGTIDIFLRDRQTGTTTLVSTTASGTSGNSSSASPSISADGSRVAFLSVASDLVAGDTNASADVFVRDIPSSTTWLVSRLPSGTLSDGDSLRPMLSGDGQLVAYLSYATNFVGPHPSPGAGRVMLSAVPSGFIEEISVNTAGQPANGFSVIESISHDGQRVLFGSTATNVGPVPVPSGNMYLRDRATGTSTLVTRLASGLPANGQTTAASISSNGQFALVSSSSSNLTVGHSGTNYDAFIVHLDTSAVRRISLPPTFPGEPNRFGVDDVGEVSDDGLRAFFSSDSTNLLAGEPNDSLTDIYFAQASSTWFRDADGDQYGDANVVSNLTPPPSGYVSTALDCDDNQAGVNPGVIDICNGIDDDCDGVTDPGFVLYCTAPPSVQGCNPVVATVGTPSVTASTGFHLTVSSLPGARRALFTYSLSPASLPYATGNQSRICTGAPRVRTTNLPTGGTLGSCNGSLALDWFAWMAANPAAIGQPLQAGSVFYAQAWYRDPGTALNSNLTRGIRFSLCP